MLFKVVFICDEVEDFLREITIDADASFLDFNKAILDACNYTDDQVTSFYTCNDDWEQQDQITREDMGLGDADKDIYIMSKTCLRDFIHDEDQKRMYGVDTFNDRVFYLKVTEFITGKTLKKPKCTRSKGEAPTQIADVATSLPAGNADADDLGDDNNYFGSDDFDQEDFDSEGFEIEEH